MSLRHPVMPTTLFYRCRSCGGWVYVCTGVYAYMCVFDIYNTHYQNNFGPLNHTLRNESGQPLCWPHKKIFIYTKNYTQRILTNHLILTTSLISNTKLIFYTKLLVAHWTIHYQSNLNR